MFYTVEAYRRGGMPEYQRVLRDSLGIGFVQLRIDTIHLGVYECDW